MIDLFPKLLMQIREKVKWGTYRIEYKMPPVTIIRTIINKIKKKVELIKIPYQIRLHYTKIPEHLSDLTFYHVTVQQFEP